MTLVQLEVDPPAAGWWSVWLLGSVGQPAAARDLTSGSVVGPHMGLGQLDAAGEAVVDLPPTASLTPAGTAYRADLRADGSGVTVPLTFTVPALAAGVVVRAVDFETDPPGTLPTSALAVEVARASAAELALAAVDRGKVDVTDVRLVNARVPTGGAGGVLGGNYPNPGFAVDMATQAELDGEATARATADNLRIPAAEKGAANGVATLDAGSRLLAAQLPPIAISEYLGAAANQAAMLALVGQRGDWCTRLDSATTWILKGDDASVLANWQVLPVPTDLVTSVDGQVGAVNLNATYVPVTGDKTVTGTKSFDKLLTGSGLVVWLSHPRWGAPGGSGDNSAALDAAMQYVNSLGGGSVIIDGVYNVASPVKAYNGVRLVGFNGQTGGANMASILRYTGTGSAAAFQFGGRSLPVGITNGSTSVTGNFLATDAGKVLTAYNQGIPNGATLSSIVPGTSAVLSAPATASASLTAIVAPGQLVGFRVQGVALLYSASLTGNIVEMPYASVGCGLDDVYIGSAGNATTANACLLLDQATTMTFNRVSLQSAAYGIIGRLVQASYCNNMLFTSCHFIGCTSLFVKNAGQGWAFDSPTIEYTTGGNAGFYGHDAEVRAEGFTVRGAWAGDITAAAASPQITWAGDGLLIEGNFLGWNNGTLVKVDENNCNGIALICNRFDAFHTTAPTYAVDFGATTGHTGFMLFGWGSQTPLTQLVAGIIPNGSIIQGTDGLSRIHGTTGVDALAGIPTNLMTVDQASADTTLGSWGPFDNSKNTVTRQTAPNRTYGPDKGVIVSTTNVAGPQDIRIQTYTGTGGGLLGGTPVVPGQVITAMVSVMADQVGRVADLILQWLDAAGAQISVTAISGVQTLSTATWKTFTFTVAVPAGAFGVFLQPRVYGTLLNETYRFARASVHVGRSATWQRPGDKLAVTASSIRQAGTNANSSLSLSSAGTGVVSVNGPAGSGSGGLVVGDGSGDSKARGPASVSVLTTTGFATASRPTPSAAGSGAMVYDTTLSKPIWSDGTTWRDSAGTAV